MNNDSLSSSDIVVDELNTDRSLNTDLESAQSRNIKNLISNNLGQGSGLIGTTQSEIEVSLDSSSGEIVSDTEFDIVDIGLVDTDTPLFATNSKEIFTTKVPRTGNVEIDAISYPAKIDGSTITYSFFDGGSYYGSERNVRPITEKMKGYLRNILESFEKYIPIDFVEVSDAGDNFGQIRYMFSNGPSTAYTKVPYKYQDGRTDRYKGGDIHFSPGSRSEFDKGPGAYRYETLIHETLHALNLKHPGNYNGSSNGGQSGPFLPSALDNSNNSILSYNRLRYSNNYSGTISPMAYDIRAMQYLYGAAEYNQGDTTYKFAKVDEYYANGEFNGNPNSNSKQTLWDSGGKDTFDLSDLKFESSGYRVDIREGGVLTTQKAYLDTTYKARGDGKNYKATSRGTFIAYDVTINNIVTSSSDDYIIANNSANNFSGYIKGQDNGDDTIKGADGRDNLDLTAYSSDELTTSTQGNDYVINLGNKSSITIKDHFAVAEGDRLNILTAGGNPNPNPNPTPTNGNLVWEEQGLTDESAVATGSNFNLGNGVTATVNWQIVNESGSFVAHAGEDFVSYDSGVTGNHTGYLSLGFDNGNDDPNDLIKLSLDFNQAVTGLTFSLLDVDQSAGKTFDDGVEIYADGVNIKDLSGVTIDTGANVMADNEPYMNGFEGRGTAGASNSSEGGNIDISFGSTEVSSLEIKYFSTDDAISNPGSQKIGISDFSFQSA